MSLLLLVAAFPLKSVVDFDRVIQLGNVPLVSLPKLAGVLFFSLFLVYALRHRSELRFDKTHALLLMFLGIAVASTLHARVPSAALVETARYAGFIALYFALAQLLSIPRTRARVVWTLVTASAATAAFALVNLLTWRTPLATTAHGDANDVAFMLASVLPLAIWLAGWQARARIIGIAMSGLIALGIALSFSRGALVGLAAGTFWLAVVERRHARTILTGVACCALLVALLLWFDPAHLRQSISAKQNVAWANVTNRIAAWQSAVQLAIEHPLLGVGPGNFQFYYADYWRAHPGAHQLRVVHNSYLEIACEMGLVALAFFGAFLAITFTRLGEIVRQGRADAGLAIALRTSLVVALVGGLFVSEQLFAPYWLVAGIANAVWISARRHRATRR